MINQDHTSATCFECINEAGVPEYYRLYITNGPLAIAYLKRKQQEHFKLIKSAPGGFLQDGGTGILTVSSREALAQILHARWRQYENNLWEVVRWSEVCIKPSLREQREDHLRRIKASLQCGCYSRYYEPSLCMWSEEAWGFFDLEITPSHLSLTMENDRGEQETDCILLEDRACFYKFLYTYREDGFPMYQKLYSRTPHN